MLALNLLCHQPQYPTLLLLHSCSLSFPIYTLVSYTGSYSYPDGEDAQQSAEISVISADEAISSHPIFDGS